MVSSRTYDNQSLTTDLFSTLLGPIGSVIRAITYLRGHDVSEFNQLLGKGATAIGAKLGMNRSDADIETDEATLDQTRKSWQSNVTGMQQAGLNPALMYGTASGASSLQAQSPTAGDFSDIMTLAMMPAQLRLMDAQAKELQSSASKQSAEVKKIESDTSLNDSRKAEIEQGIAESKSRIALQLEQSKTEERRRYLLTTQSILNNANAERINALLPYETALNEARTYGEYAQAEHNLVSAAYQQGLIDRGMIEAEVYATLQRGRHESEEVYKTHAEGVIADYEAYLTNPEYDGENDGFLKRLNRSIVSAVKNIAGFITPFK